MTQHDCVQLDHVLHMYHLRSLQGPRPSSIREESVESATSIKVQQAHSLRKMAHGVRPPACRSFAVYARTHRSSATLPYGISTPDHQTEVDRYKLESVAASQLKNPA